MQDFFHHQYVKFHIRKLYRVGSSFSTNWWISRKRDTLVEPFPLDSRKIVRILRFTTLRLERENISHLSRESRKIIDSKVPASKGICDRSQEGQISGQGIFLAINSIFWYCWWKIPANQSDMVNITMIYRVFFPPSKRFFGPWDFWSINVVWCWSTDMAQGIKLKYDEKKSPHKWIVVCL